MAAAASELSFFTTPSEQSEGISHSTLLLKEFPLKQQKPHKQSAREAVRPPPASAKRFAVAPDTEASAKFYPTDEGDGNHPPIPTPPLCFIDKAETLRRVSLTYVTVWKLMRDNKFPRSRNLGGKSAWLEHEVEAWIKSRPLVPIKDEGETQQTAEG
jgi:predicted DNA-binding transcriptional regulator AlpA